jgi:hypothetical protein
MWYDMTIATGKRVSAKEAAAIPDSLADLNGIIDVSAFILPPGIYFLYLGDELQYIGQSIEPSARVVQHKKKGKKFDRIFFMPAPVDSLLQIESDLIKKHRPSLNNVPGSSGPYNTDPALNAHMNRVIERDVAQIRERLAAEAAADPQYKLFGRRTKRIGI